MLVRRCLLDPSFSCILTSAEAGNTGGWGYHCLSQRSKLLICFWKGIVFQLSFCLFRVQQELRGPVTMSILQLFSNMEIKIEICIFVHWRSHVMVPISKLLSVEAMSVLELFWVWEPQPDDTTEWTFLVLGSRDGKSMPVLDVFPQKGGN